MTAAGKVNASKVEAGDRIIIIEAENGTIHESRNKTGENVYVVRVTGKRFRAAQGPYEARGKYIIETTAGEFEAATIQTMWLAPEDAAGIKRAHVEALEADKRINRAATAEEIAAPAAGDALRTAVEAARNAETDEEAAEILSQATGIPVTEATARTIAQRKATSVEKMDEIVGTMEGHRAIRIDFKMKDGAPGASVTFDFYGNGAAFNGATYARIESAALRAMADAGRIGEIETFSNRLIR